MCKKKKKPHIFNAFFKSIVETKIKPIYNNIFEFEITILSDENFGTQVHLRFLNQQSESERRN